MNGDWIKLEYGVHLNRRWLESGLKILCSNENYYDCAGENFFKVNHRTTLYKHCIQGKEEILQFENQSVDRINGSEINRNSFEFACDTFSTLNEFSKKNSGFLLMQPMQGEEFYLESAEKQEIFMPFLLEKSSKNMIPAYLSVALNDLTKCGYFRERFNGFKRFVTAGCLFGASLQAVDKKGAIFPIIQHKIAFAEGDQIVELNPPDKELHPYELAQFSYLKDNVSLMKKMAKDDIPVEVLYHLPHIDYILSAIKLFIHNRISYEALLNFYVAVKERAKKHSIIIKDIFKNSGLILRLESPFSNLLKDFSDSNYDVIYIDCLDEFSKKVVEENKVYVAVKDEFLVYKILSPAGRQEEGSTNIVYAAKEFPPQETSEVTEKVLDFIIDKGHARGLNAFLLYLQIPIQNTKFIQHKKLEQEVVKIILNGLCNNEILPEYAVVWKDVLKIDFGRDKIRDIESLFKIANAMMIAVAAKNFEDHAVCSFLPFNENPIFNKYKRCHEQFTSAGIQYPEVFSLVRLEDLIFYSRISTGNVFYFQPCSSKLSTSLSNGMLMHYNALANKESVFREDYTRTVGFGEQLISDSIVL